MTRRAGAFALALSTLLSALTFASGVAAAPPLPGSMAAVGDSITQAASTAGSLGVDAPQNSWATGTNATVNSHYLRLTALNPAISGQAHNLSVSGAKMAGLQVQMANAAGLQPDYVTVLMGGNDLCTPTEAGMTPVADFQAQFAAAMSTLRATSPDTHVYVVSIPRVMGLWELFRNNWWARFVWSAGGVCQSLLARPTSTEQADVDRRARVDQRNREFNAALAAVCAASQPCQTDNGAAYNTPFVASDVSGDYFHPSTTGQAKIARVTWDVGPWAGAVPPPPPNQAPTAAFTASCNGMTCAFTDGSTDADGTIATRSWSFGDGATSRATNPSRTYTAAGTYTVTLTVTDDDGSASSASRTVTVTAPVVQQMRVDSLTATTAKRSSTWRTTVTITVERTDGTPVSGARVSATWSRGAADACTTGSTGRCSVTSDWLRRSSVSSVTMTVSGLTHTTLAWDQAGSQRQIIVARPS